ncbi:hypothetical protein JXA88_01235 [Candidatus Fermentibacteria bacterium]|nr:hypothetical protein [Candidatus Fermentibacteria bacterium]
MYRAIVLCLLPSVLHGNVVTLSPLPADVQTAELERLAGMWQWREEVVHVTVEDGAAIVAAVAWNGSSFVERRGELTVTQGEHRSFLCVAGYDPSLPGDQFIFAQYRLLSDDHLLVWVPRITAFESAVEQGVLATAEASTADRLVLDTESDALLAFLDDPLRTDVFDYENPVLLCRAGRYWK